MTRGTFFLILKDKYFRSVEFNGDMYPTGYGDEGLKLLEEVEDEKEFEFMVNKFNKEHHNYDDEEVVFERNNEVLFKYLDLSRVDYFNFWFSDWVFIKNKSGRSIKFIISESILEKSIENVKIPYVLKNGETVRCTKVSGCVEGFIRKTTQVSNIIYKQVFVAKEFQISA